MFNISSKKENLALATHARKRKGRINIGNKNVGGESAPVEEQKKKDLSRIMRYNFHTFGHYAYLCTQNKRKRK